jgi:hypothetical protein
VFKPIFKKNYLRNEKTEQNFCYFGVAYLWHCFGSNFFSSFRYKFRKSENSTVEKVVLSPKEQIEENISRMKNDPVLKTANWGFV